MTMLYLLSERLETWSARYKLRNAAYVGLQPCVQGNVWIHGKGEVQIGDRVVLDGSFAPIELHTWAGAVIIIGDDCYVGSGTSIEATSSIRLGARVRVGAFCRVMDNHFHAITGDRRALPSPRPVVVKSDVEIGARSILLAGAWVARGATIGAGSVIARRLPARGA